MSDLGTTRSGGGGRLFSLIHLPSGSVVATVRRADGWWARGWGVLGCPTLPPGEGLWLPGVASVHTLFVRFPMDLLFLDADFRAVRALAGVKSWRPLVAGPGAQHTIELGAGTLPIPLPARGEQWDLRIATSG